MPKIRTHTCVNQHIPAGAASSLKICNPVLLTGRKSGLTGFIVAKNRPFGNHSGPVKASETQFPTALQVLVIQCITHFTRQFHGRFTIAASKWTGDASRVPPKNATDPLRSLATSRLQTGKLGWRITFIKPGSPEYRRANISGPCSSGAFREIRGST